MGFSRRFQLSKMSSPFREIDHLRRGVHGEGVGREPRYGRDVPCHFPDTINLSLIRIRQETDHQILECDDAYALLHDVDVRPLRYLQ